MAKTSSEDKNFRSLQAGLLKRLTTYKALHDLGEKTDERLARGNTLNQMSKSIRKVAAMERPDLILNFERHCEQFDLEYFATTQAEKDSRISSLQMIGNVIDVVKIPANPEKYRAGLIENLGERNMDKFVSAPQDTMHVFVKSQTQKLTKAPGRMATPPEQGYFMARKEALKVALKAHEKNCEKALGMESKNSGQGR